MEVAFDIYTVLCEISKAHKDLGETINESVKGAAAMGGATFTGALAGGLLGGPVGMIAGGAIGFAGGATYAAANVKSFKPLHQVLSEMTKEDRQRVVEAARVIVTKKGIDLANQIVGKYGSQLAREFLIDVFKELSKDKLND